MKIYTKTGDEGETGIIGSRISKGSNTIELIGTLDEANASLGIIASEIQETAHKELEAYIAIVHSMQSSLFSIGAVIAGGNIETNFTELLEKMEASIDLFEENLPQLQNFILPGGSRLAAHIHLSRSICRKAERTFVRYVDKNDTLDNDLTEPIQKYLNRLSDWLFMFARFANMKLNVKDIPWKS